ncbi:hypothetical protein [Neobacillus fumarioli]|uniref:hypothetical protein n=1 Tax=Neobacillus fumarioli TaxID=105229 RepID=UPI000B044A04|nr:hypothetical protein [Neobacillus fumarioli]
MQNPYYNEAKPSLIIRKLQPENKEAPIQFMEAPITDKKLFYRRNHFSYPRLAQANYWLPVNGHVRTPKLFSIDELRNLPPDDQGYHGMCRK